MGQVMNTDYIWKKKNLRLTAYFKIGEDIGYREGRSTLLRTPIAKHGKKNSYKSYKFYFTYQNMGKKKKTRTNLINFTYLARRKWTGCQHRCWTLDELHDPVLNNENMLLVDLVMNNGINSLHRDLTVMYAPSNA